MRRHGRAFGERYRVQARRRLHPYRDRRVLVRRFAGKNAHPDKAMGAKAARSALESFAAAKDGTAGFGSLSSRETWVQDAARLWGRWAGPSRL